MFRSRFAPRVLSLQLEGLKSTTSNFGFSSCVVSTRTPTNDDLFARSKTPPFRKITTMTDSHTLDSLATKLLGSTRLTHPPVHSTYPELTAVISSLQLHPTIETVLHMANSDLPSAHFLVRHMQAPPAVEGMLLHGILHRAEGDMPNARAWISDVKDACEGYRPKKRDEGEKLDEAVFAQTKGGAKGGTTMLEFVYGGADPNGLVDDVQACRSKKQSQRGEGEEEGLERRARAELQSILEWCKAKFGAREWRDASKAWVKNSEEISEISAGMVSGGKGFREF
jgi:hypothetical protein